MKIHYFGTGAMLYNGKTQVFLNQSEYNTYLTICNNFQLIYNTYYESVILKEVKSQYRNENMARARIKELHKYIGEDISRGDDQITGVENCYYPQTVVFFLTNRCLHRCLHCFRESNCNRKEMCLSDAVKIAEILKGKVSRIVISGGEPLLHSEISMFIKTCRDSFDIEVMSSLYLGKELDVSVLNGVNRVQVTIYGSNAEEHDKFVNKQGSFREVCTNIVKLIASGMNVILNSMNNHEESLEDVIMLAIRLGIKEIQFGEIEPIGRAAQNRERITFYKISKAIIQKLQMKYMGKITILYDEGCGEKKNGKICGAGLIKYDIDEMGNVYPCLFANKNPIGNILMDNNIFEKKISTSSKACWEQSNCGSLEQTKEILKNL